MVKNSATLIPATETVSISVLSLMVWGSPGSFGVEDKELRMAAIGDFIAGDSDHDVFLLNDVRTLIIWLSHLSMLIILAVDES